MLTNGFDTDKVKSAMAGRLGWMQPTQAGSPVINTANLGATSGRFYNDGSFHAACTIDRLKSSQEDAAITDANLNALLTTLDQSVAMRVINAVFNRPQLVEHTLVYERVSNVRNIPVPNSGNFCGYRIKVGKGDWAIQLNSISLFFDSVATFNIYLFNDLKLAPLKTQSVTTEANSQTVVDLGWVLNYISTNKGGLFYIGYFQDDLVATSTHAIDEQLNMWAASKVFGAYPFQAPKKAGVLDFNRINPSVVFRTYGLNLEVTSYRDYTQTIIQNPHLFDNARGLGMAIGVLETIKYSTRSNAVERQSKDAIGTTELNYDLNLAFPNDDRPFIAGLKAQLMQELNRISQSFFPKAKAMSVGIGGDYDREAFAYDTFDIKNLPPRERFY